MRFAAALLLLVALPSTAEDRSYVVDVDDGGRVSRIGDFNVGTNPRLGRAIKTLGTPDTRVNPRGATEACRVVWNNLGLTILFSNFGGADACRRDGGNAQRLKIAGTAADRWRTWAGLKLGMTERELERRHPGAVQRRHGYWLTTVMRPYGENCPCPAGGLKAWTYRGRVSSFRSWLGFAGD